jgi:hypothetical protein
MVRPTSCARRRTKAHTRGPFRLFSFSCLMHLVALVGVQDGQAGVPRAICIHTAFIDAAAVRRTEQNKLTGQSMRACVWVGGVVQHGASMELVKQVAAWCGQSSAEMLPQQPHAMPAVIPSCSTNAIRSSDSSSLSWSLLGEGKVSPRRRIDSTTFSMRD